MSELDLHDAVEMLSDTEVEVDGEHHVENGEVDRRVRARVTALVVLVTALTAVAAFLAARSDGKALLQERHEHIQALAAQNDESKLSVLDQQVNDFLLGSQIDFYRGAALDLVGNTTASNDWLMNSDDGFNKWLDTDDRSAYWLYAWDTEDSISIGKAAVAWRNDESKYIATAGMLAISLFLLGLVLTVPRHRRIRWLFFGAAAAIAAVSLVRLVLTSVNHVPSVSNGTLKAYARGQTDLWEGQSGAARPFRLVVQEQPTLPEGWYGLGQALDGSSGSGFPSRDNLAGAVTAYRRAIELGYGNLHPAVWNNLAFDELAMGKIGAAGRDVSVGIKLARQSGVDLAWSQTTRAEVLMFEGNEPAAEKTIAEAEYTLISTGKSVDVAESFFTGLRDDWVLFSHEKLLPASRLQTFYSFVGQLEAAYDEQIYVPKSTTATISDFQVSYQPLDSTQGSGLMTVAFSYAHFPDYKHGKFSLQTYQIDRDDVEILLQSSVLDGYPWTWGTTGSGSWQRPWPLEIFPGDVYEVEAYVDGNLLAHACLKASSSGTTLEPSTKCLI